MDLVLIRHPATALDAGICYGRSDVPLAGDARASSDAVFSRLTELGAPPPRTLWTSPLRRCASVAAWLARRCGSPVTADARLQEMNFGAWERLRWDTIDRAALDAWAANFMHARVHGGESVAQFAARVGAWFDAWQASYGPSAGAQRAASNARRPTALAAPEVAPNSGAAPPLAGAAAADPARAPGAVPLPARSAGQAASAAYVVTHAGVIRVLASLTLGIALEELQSWPLELAGIVWIRRERADDPWRLVRWNA
jgi:alpha-ribazole phosphatase